MTRTDSFNCVKFAFSGTVWVCRAVSLTNEDEGDNGGGSKGWIGDDDDDVLSKLLSSKSDIETVVKEFPFGSNNSFVDDGVCLLVWLSIGNDCELLGFSFWILACFFVIISLVSSWRYPELILSSPSIVSVNSWTEPTWLIELVGRLKNL